jgi:hypothetical protein
MCARNTWRSFLNTDSHSVGWGQWTRSKLSQVCFGQCLQTILWVARIWIVSSSFFKISEDRRKHFNPKIWHLIVNLEKSFLLSCPISSRIATALLFKVSYAYSLLHTHHFTLMPLTSTAHMYWSFALSQALEPYHTMVLSSQILVLYLIFSYF